MLRRAWTRFRRRATPETALFPVYWLAGFRGIPAMARPTFRYDLWSSVFGSLAAGVLLPSFAQLFARKTLLAPSWILPLIVAAAAMGNFAGAFVAQYLQGRRRIPYVVNARVITAGAMVAVAFLPARPPASWPYVVLQLMPALMGAIVLNVQSGVWHSNYPEAFRGRIFSRIIIVRLACLALSTRLAGQVLDAMPLTGHRLIYPAGALFTLLSAWAYSRIKVRRESAMLSRERPGRFHFLAALRILREDRIYREYMTWQFVSGSAVLMVESVIVLALIEKFRVNYALGTTGLVLVPAIVEILSVPLAGYCFDRVGIMRYRTVNASLWALRQFLIFVGLLTGSWRWLLVGFAAQGIAQSTGGVVWSIGHTKFARPDQSQLYMGAHMTLTGVRGLIMPFIGVWLYRTSLVHVWVVCLAGAIQVLAAFEFYFATPPRQERGMPPDVA